MRFLEFMLLCYFQQRFFGIWWRILIVFLGVIKFPRIILSETDKTKPIHLIKTLISVSALITIYFKLLNK